MKRLIIATVGAALLAGGPAVAGPAADAFGKCLVDSSTGRDRTDFVRWMFVALSTHPAVSSLVSVTPEIRKAANQRTAEIMDRLILVDCRKEAVEAVRLEGRDAFSKSFEVFGRTAMTEMVSNPSVNQEMSGFATYLDQAKWDALMQEAGKK